MNYQTITTLLFAGCCLFAVVSMAATLEHGVQGTPDDVVDVDLDTLPLPTDEAEQLKESVQSSSKSAESGGTGTAERDSDSDRPGPSESADASEADSADASGQPSGGSSGSSIDSSSDTTKGGTIPSPPDGLLALLRQLLQRLLGVLGGLLLLGVMGLAAYKHDLLWERLRDVLGRNETQSAAHGAAAARARRSPENQVEEVWAQMLSVAGVSDEPHETPRESADAAVEAGLRPEPVRDLTALFEDVRYGEKSVTAEDRRRASNYLRGTLPEDDD